jgi:hypothetical protein
MFKITITMTTNMAMSHREQEQIEDYLSDNGYETIRFEQKEVEPKPANS